MTFVDNDGLMPGTYRARIDCWETPPNLEGKPVKSFLPEKFQNAESSGWEIKVEPRSKPLVLKFDIKLEK